MNWDQVKQLISEGRLERLQRSEECTRQYQEHKKALGKVDLATFVLSRLQWSSTEIEVLNNDRYRTREAKIQASFSKKQYYKLTRNDFPYDFEPDVHHLLIWSKISLPLYGDASDECKQDLETHERIEQFLKINLAPFDVDYCWFVNYSALQSIRKISHVHLLVKTTNKEIVEEKILGSPGLQPLETTVDGIEKTQESLL